MTVISLAHSNIVQARSSSRGGMFRANKANRLLAVFLIFLIILCGFLYVLQTNFSTGKGYKIRELKGRLGELSEINKSFQISVSNLKSVDSLQLKTEALKMVQIQVRGIEYLAFPSVNVVAVK